MNLAKKTTFFFSILAVVVIVVLITLSIYSFRQIYLKAAETQANTAAEIVRVHLTESMLNGTIKKRKQFLDRLNSVKGLMSATVSRSPSVVKQHGPGLEGESDHDSIEQQVSESGKAYFGLMETADGPVFRASIPYKAEIDGVTNCLTCHQTTAGAVLGVITLKISLAEQRRQTAWMVGLVTATIVLFALGAAFFSQRTAKPLIEIANQVHGTVNKAKAGDYSGHIDIQRSDELGQIVNGINRLLDHLSVGLTSVSGKVAHLMRYNLPQTTNLLDTTTEMVDCLVDVSTFKQAIEEDETKEEIYARIAQVMQNEFLIDRFSIYEVDNAKHRMAPMIIDGLPDNDCHWCKPEILMRADSCRAKRTGHTIDAVATPGICTAFANCDELKGKHHICIPILQSGAIGSVIQMITDDTQAPLLHKMLPFIQIYLREAAPVLESKRLMATLRESTLTDPMTGLRNRRFLQEYVDTLTSYTTRKKSHFSVLMADLDFFKQVNDQYGHEAGDTTLKQLATILKQSVRASDMVIRYGGEEFLIILMDTGVDAADSTAEKIRAAVEKQKIQLSGATINKTLSIGVAVYPDDSETFWQVVKYADVALYKAKEAGRNRVLHFQPEMWDDEQSY